MTVKKCDTDGCDNQVALITDKCERCSKGVSIAATEGGTATTVKAKKKKAAKPKKVKLPLLVALEFLKCAQTTGGDQPQTHVKLFGGYACAFNHIIAAGHPIQEAELNVCVNTTKLIEALKNFKTGDSITQFDQVTISLAMGDLNAKIIGINPAILLPEYFDQFTHFADNDLKDHIKALDKLTKAGKTIVESSILITENSVFACDGDMIIERVHSLQLPQKSILPKKSAQALMRIKEDLTSVGYGDKRISFLFANGAWMRTQCYTEDWPPVEEHMSDGAGAIPIPEKFFEGVEKLLPFSSGGILLCTPEGLRTNEFETASVFTMEGLPKKIWVNGAKALMLKDHVTHVLFNDDGTYHFFGECTRAALSETVAL